MTEQEVKDMTSAEARKAISNAYVSVFSGDAGKLVLADLKKTCKGDESSVPSSGQIDPYRVVYRQGMANIYYEIMRLVSKGKL